MPRTTRRIYPGAVAFLRPDPWRLRRGDPIFWNIGCTKRSFSDLSAHGMHRVLLGCGAHLAKPPIYLRLLIYSSSSLG
jgi:hypothetical protein